MTKRGIKEGSVYKRADGLWVGAVTLDPVDGKRRRKTVYGKTQAEAIAKLRKVQQDIDKGLPVGDDRLTVGAFLDRWLKVNVPGTVADSTLANYQDLVRLHLRPSLGATRLRKLTVADMDALWARKRDEGYKPNSIRLMRCVMRRALGQAEREGLVPRNVAALSAPPRLDQAEGRALTVEQAQSLLAAAKGHRLELAFTLMLAYGLRRGEVLGLTWSGLNWDADTLAVRQGVKRVRTGEPGTPSRIVVGELKTRHSRRTIYLTPPLVEALRSHRARQGAERLAAGPLWEAHDLIFPSTVGTPHDPDNFAKEFVKVCKAAGLGHWHPHEARHSAASIMLAQGTPLHVVSEVLGHTSIRVTKDVYGHLLEGDKRSAAAAVSSALFLAK